MGETEIAKLLIKIGLNADDAEKAAKELGKELDHTEEKASGLEKTFKALAKTAAAVGATLLAAGTAAFALVNKVTQAGDEVAKTAKKIGVGVEELQRLRFAAERSGASQEVLTQSLRQQALFMEQAARGGASEFRAALDSIGLSLSDIQGLNAEERMGVMADRLNQIRDPARRTAIAMQLFGARAGAELVPLLSEGADGIKALGDEAQALNLVMSEEQAAASEHFQDSLTNVKGVISGVVRTVAMELVPVIERVIVKFTDWVKANQGLIQSKLQTFLEAGVKAIEIMVQALGYLIENWQILAGILGGAALARGFSAAASGFQSMGIGASAALGPIGAVTGALLALIPIAVEAGNAIGDALGRQNVVREEERGAQEFLGGLSAEDQAAVKEANAEIARQQATIDSSPGAALEYAATQLRDAAVRRKREIESRARANRETSGQALGGLLAGGLGGAGGAISADMAETNALLASGDLVLGSASNKGRGGGKRAPKPEEKLSDVTLAELGLPGVKLEDLAERTPAANSIEPTIALTVINNTFNMEVDQTITSNASAADVAGEANRGVATVVEKMVAKAFNATQTPVAV